MTALAPSEPPASDPTRLWEPRRALTLAQARQRSDRVALLRMGFVAAAMVSAGVLIGFVLGHALGAMGGPGGELTREEAARMISPRFSGRDGRGELYVITAQAAIRQRDDRFVELEFPDMENASGAVVTAEDGLFDRSERTLQLTGDVVMTDPGGNVFRSSEALVYLDENRVVGRQAVTGTGPTGELRADSYELREGGAILLLEGAVWTRILPEADAPATPAPSETNED